MITPFMLVVFVQLCLYGIMLVSLWRGKWDWFGVTFAVLGTGFCGWIIWMEYQI